MIHYTCDRCHREIDTDIEVRYSVEVQAKAIFESGPCQSAHDDDCDHLMELHEILERMDEQEEPSTDSGCCQHQFDLCSDCYKVYSRNPLAREVPVSIHFSEN